MDVSKLKVADLKKELKSRGLNTNGTKNELAERLQEALQDIDQSVDNDDLLDEDAVLAEESEILSNSGTLPNEDDADLLSPTIKTPPSASTTETTKPPTKKVVLNRNTAPASKTILEAKEAEATKSEEESPGVPKKVKLSEIPMQERLKLRAQKFGVGLPESAKKDVRAERFGLKNSSPAAAGKPSGVDEETLKKRREKFGIVAPEADGSQKQKRAERFGAKTNPQDEEIKRKRAERFGLA